MGSLFEGDKLTNKPKDSFSFVQMGGAGAQHSRCPLGIATHRETSSVIQETATIYILLYDLCKRSPYVLCCKGLVQNLGATNFKFQSERQRLANNMEQ